MGSSARHILGGALQGIGAGLVQQGQQRAAAEAASAQSEAAMRREIALENLRTKNAMTRDQQQSVMRMDEQENAGRVSDWQAGRQVGRTTQATIVTDKAKTQNDITLKQLDAQNDRALASLKSSLSVNETQQKIAAEAIADATKNRYEVGETQIRADGALVLYSKSGQVISVSKPGQFTPPAATGMGAGFPAFPGASSPAPAPGPAAAPSKRPPLSSFNTG